jgi:hypothetical protein
MVLAWIVQKGAPAEHLYAELEKTVGASQKRRMEILLALEKKGWIKLLGVVKGSPADVAAVIQEHFETRSVPLRTKRGRHVSKKRMG